MEGPGAGLTRMASSFVRRDAVRPVGAETLYLPDPDADTGRAPDWAAGTVTFVVEDWPERPIVASALNGEGPHEAGLLRFRSG